MEESSLLIKSVKEDFSPPASGDLLEGEILNISKTKILVNIDNIGLGIVPASEFGDIPLNQLKKGQRVLVYVLLPEDEEGNLLLSLKRAGKERVWYELKQKFLNKEIFPVKVVDANRGGLIVEINNIQGFLPASQLSLKYYPKAEGGDKEIILEKLNSLVGKTLDVRLINFDKDSNKLIFSEKAAMVARQREAMKDKYAIGQTIKGVVSGIVDFGAFVVFDGLEGLIHISEIDWGKVEDINQYLKVGQEVEAMIIAVEDEKISLSLKRLKPDPWLDKTKNLKVGDKIQGTINKIFPFGALVKLPSDVEGFVYYSDNGKFIDPATFEIGKTYTFQIKSIEPENHRITLSFCHEENQK